MVSITEQNKLLRTCAALLFWIVVWQVAASAANRSLLIPLPTPVTTASALMRLSAMAEFWSTVAASLLRISAGFILAFLIGSVCALVSSRNSLFRFLMAPVLQIIRSVPVASLTIVVFLWIGRDRIPTAISFFTVFPIIWANVENGLSTVDRDLCEMAALFGMPKKRILTEIVLPGLHPFFVSALANGLGFAWKSGVAAEVICRTAHSLGNLLWVGKSAIEYDEVFAVTLVIVLLSTVLQLLAVRIVNHDKWLRIGEKR